MTFNSLEPSSGMHRHAHYHADGPERERKGLVDRICYTAEPMAVARMELAIVLAEHVRNGDMTMDHVDDCADDIKADVYRLLRERPS